MSPLTSYRRLLGLAGPQYVALAFLARLPLAMSQLGTLLLVSSATGRYAAGGLAAGALALGTAVSGLLVPQVGSLARVRWVPHVRRGAAAGPRLVSTAYAYESAADEASSVLGPALVGLLVALVDPALALLLAAALLAVFGTAFALHPTARLAHAPRPRSGSCRHTGPGRR